jgi:hypothetical protein
MTELEVRDQQLVTPQGSIVDLSKPEEVAIAYDDLQQLKRMLNEVEGKLKQALVEHSRVIGKKSSFELAGVAKVEIKGGTTTSYDPHAIKAGLKKAGCPADRISEIVRETIEYKVMAVEAKRAAKANDDYAAVIEANSKVEEKAPTVTVKRIGGGRHGDGGGHRELTTATPTPPADDVVEKLPWE